MTQLAWAVDELSADAQIIRQALGALIGSAGGTVGPTGLAVTQKGTPAMFVLIRGGTPEEGGAFIPGFTATTGPYFFQNSASFELPITAADATNPRIDRIVARVYDNAVDSLGKHEAKFEALVGTAEAGATLGNLKGEAALPKNCYTLAHVLVPALATSIVTADILNSGELFKASSAMGGSSVWTAVTLGAKMEEALGFQTVRARTEGNGLVRLRGTAKVKAGQTLAAGEPVVTLPAGMRPPANVSMIASSASAGPIYLVIPVGGAIEYPGGSLGAGQVVLLDNITFSIS